MRDTFWKENHGRKTDVHDGVLETGRKEKGTGFFMNLVLFYDVTFLKEQLQNTVDDR